MFPDDNACKAYLASRRWPDKSAALAVAIRSVYRLRGFRWQCQACNSKGYQFSVLVGTIFENTKIPSRRPVSQRSTGNPPPKERYRRGTGPITPACSDPGRWFLCHRIRAALTMYGFRKTGGVVESTKDREESSASTSTRPRNWGRS